jgi:hypothetical protein
MCKRIINGNIVAEEINSEIKKHDDFLIFTQRDKKTNEILNPLYSIIFNKRKDLFDKVIKREYLDLTLDDNSKIPVYFSAAMVDDVYYLNKLIELGVDVEKTDGYGKTMLNYAVENNRIENASIILRNSKNQQQWKEVSNDNAIIFSAIRSNDPVILKWCIDENYTLNAVDDKGHDVIEYFFIEIIPPKLKGEMMDIFLTKGPNLFLGKMLAWETIDNDWDGKWLLLSIQQKGIDIFNEKNSDGDTIAVLLLQKKMYGVLNFFISWGLDIMNFNHYHLNVYDYMTQILGYGSDEVLKLKNSD